MAALSNRNVSWWQCRVSLVFIILMNLFVYIYYKLFYPSILLLIMNCNIAVRKFNQAQLDLLIYVFEFPKVQTPKTSLILSGPERPPPAGYITGWKWCMCLVLYKSIYVPLNKLRGPTCHSIYMQLLQMKPVLILYKVIYSHVFTLNVHVNR